MTYESLADGPETAIGRALRGDASGLRIATSGSSGTPRDVLLGTAALRASAEATHQRLSGPGRWLLALPTDRIAGTQVLVRSHLAGTTPVSLPPGSFEPDVFVSAAATLRETTDPGVPLYSSLVPTQLRRLLASSEARGCLEAFSAVLVGGAPLGGLVRNAPCAIVETYGATETAGGCVYDGKALDGVRAEVDDSGRIHIGGDVVADGYADGEDSDVYRRDDTRWYRTPDMGGLRKGKLAVFGRMDDVIISGGYKVHPEVVEAALISLPVIEQAAVVGVPDPEWGERVVALVVSTEAAVPTAAQVRRSLSPLLPSFARPRELRSVSSLPLLKSGKIDRRAAQGLA